MNKIGKLELHNCDNMELMAKYPDNYFDLAVVDPPYGIDASKMTMGRGSGNDTKLHKKREWDNNIPNLKYFNELKRVSKEQIVWGGNYMLEFLDNTPCFLLWDKKDYNSDFASHEIAWTSFSSPVKCFIRARSKGGDNKNKIHPTQKPVALYDWIYENYSKSGFKILDTHLGSGSNAIAAHYSDNVAEFVACELDSDYYDDMLKRVKEQTAQLRLF